MLELENTLNTKQASSIMHKFSLNFLLLLVISSSSVITVIAGDDGYDRDPKLLKNIASTLCRDSVLAAKNMEAKRRNDYIKNCPSNVNYPQRVFNEKLVYYKNYIFVSVCKYESCGYYIFLKIRGNLIVSSYRIHRAGFYKGKCNDEYTHMEKLSSISYKIIKNAFGKCPENG